MAILHPFRALRPYAEHVRDVASVPYDVINTREARHLAEGKPNSFLHVIRPEIDLPEETDEHADAVYVQGAANLRRYAESDLSMLDPQATVYVYRLAMGERAQTGVYACVAVQDYDQGVILKHEKTRPVKEDDRTRHILSQRAHAEPVMLTFSDDSAIVELVEAAQETDPLYDFTADDGVQHSIWKVEDPEPLVEAFRSLEHLYVADGHHRCKAASRAWHQLEAEGLADSMPEAAYFPAVLFPMGQMHIMPYNRIVYRLPMETEAFLNSLDTAFYLERNVADPTPNVPGEVCLYAEGHWHRLKLPETKFATPADRLDVARLSEHILAPLLGITDPRTDANINFVGGIRGTDELERLVDSGEAALAVSMYPTQIEELIAVSDAGQLMPPKSTWFEPKLRSGLLVHLFG